VSSSESPNHGKSPAETPISLEQDNLIPSASQAFFRTIYPWSLVRRVPILALTGGVFLKPFAVNGFGLRGAGSGETRVRPGMLCSLPRWPDPCRWLSVMTLSRAGFFRIGSAFPASGPGRRPHCTFRGLLELYTRYGLPCCSLTVPWTLSRGSGPASFPVEPPADYRI